MTMVPVLIYAAIALAALLILGAVIARLYKRATKEVGFVRTGSGARRW